MSNLLRIEQVGFVYCNVCVVENNCRCRFNNLKKQDGTMKNFKLVAFTLMAFVACFLSACDALDFKEKLSVNKDVIDFGTEGGIDALLARSNELDVVHIRVIERATNKAVIDTALVKGQKIKELVVDGKTFCKLSITMCMFRNGVRLVHFDERMPNKMAVLWAFQLKWLSLIHRNIPSNWV